MSNLILCSACQRHVRDREVECPFCHAVIAPEAREAAARPLPPAGVPRAKLYAVGAAVAAGVVAVACGGDDTTTGTQEGGTVQAGGASGTAQAGGASGTAQAGGASGSAQMGGAAGDTQAGGAAGALADSGATGGQGGVQADAKPDVPLAHPYGCVFADPSRTTKV
jgi:hypothetical protein